MIQKNDYVSDLEIHQIGVKALYEIAKIKNAELHSAILPLESVCKSIRATALSMGLEVVDDRQSLKEEEEDMDYQ